MSRLSHVFLFDSDAKGRDTLVYGLEGDAVSVRAPGSQEEALRTLPQAPRPDVIIAVLRDADGEAVDLLRNIAAGDATRVIPRLVLAATDQLPAEVRVLAGPQSFIPLPAYVRDVITAAKLLSAAAPAAPTGQPESESRVEGTLSDYGLLFIVRTMVGLHRSGVVHVERGHRKGEVRFADGEIVGAEVGAREGQSALHQLLLWEEASLAISFRSVTRRATPILQGEALLDDLERFLRDFGHATKNIGHAQSLFVQDAEKVALSLDSIGPEIMPVMKLFDGQRHLSDVLEDSPFAAFDTLSAVARLVEMGIIRRKAIEKPSTGLPAARKPKVQEWVDRGGDAPMLGTLVTPAAAAPPPTPAAAPSASGEQRLSPGHRRRSRRRTGEIPAVSDAPPPASAPVPPAAVAPAPIAPALVTRAAANGKASGELGERTSVRGERHSARGERDPREKLEVHGELRALNKERSITPVPENMPTVLVDFGTAESGAADAAAEPARAEAAPAAEAIPVPITQNNLAIISSPPSLAPPAVAAPVAAVPAAPAPLAPASPSPGPTSIGDTQPLASPSAAATPEAAPREPVTSGIRSAEIDTGMRPAPPAAQLEAPPSGPSIMLDPHLAAEMDAFELANTAPTPPPTVTGPLPAAAPPAAQAPQPRPVPASAAGGVVSFVRGSANTSPPQAASALNTAQTVPMSTVTASPQGATASAASEAQAAAAAAPSNTAAAPPAASTGEGPGKRRASAEFDALEADFFAREAELYKHANEPTESFDDLDSAGNPPNGARQGGFTPGNKRGS